ncbi:MAG: YybH family protein [Planctomycetota bacterium]|jgi:ketosteroid isomerase-like protein
MARTIKRVLLGVLVCGLFFGCGQSNMRTSRDDVEAIRKREDEFLGAHAFNDGAKLAEFYTNDAFQKDPPIENPTVILEDVEVSGNLAFMRGVFTLKFKTDGGTRVENLRFICICRKRPDGSWVFYRDIWNTYAPIPPEQ